MTQLNILNVNNQVDVQSSFFNCREVALKEEKIPNTLDIFYADLPELLRELVESLDRLFTGEEKALAFINIAEDIDMFIEWIRGFDEEWALEIYEVFREIVKDPASYLPDDIKVLEEWYSDGQIARAEEFIELIEQGCDDVGKLLEMAAYIAKQTWVPFTWEIESNKFNFDPAISGQIKEWLEQGVFYEIVRDEIRKIHEIRDHYKAMIEPHLNEPFYQELFHDLETGSIIVNDKSGISVSYIVLDSEGNKKFILKPMDEDYGYLNARPGYASLIPDLFVNKEPYTHTLTDVFVWELARLAGIELITPEAHLGVIESDLFYDLAKGLSGELLEEWRREVGGIDSEKLVSVQRFHPNSKQLWEVLQEMQQEGMTDEEIRSSFDQTDFEQAIMLELLSGDGDGHFGNFIAYVKGVSLDGNPLYGIKVVDNSYSFHLDNNGLRNFLPYMPNGVLPLSQEGRDLIMSLKVDEICQMADNYDLAYGKEAFIERVELLQQLITEDAGMSLETLNDRFMERIV